MTLVGQGAWALYGDSESDFENYEEYDGHMTDAFEKPAAEGSVMQNSDVQNEIAENANEVQGSTFDHPTPEPLVKNPPVAHETPAKSHRVAKAHAKKNSKRALASVKKSKSKKTARHAKGKTKSKHLAKSKTKSKRLAKGKSKAKQHKVI
jgi:hypothetical protein